MMIWYIYSIQQAWYIHQCKVPLPIVIILLPYNQNERITHSQLSVTENWSIDGKKWIYILTPPSCFNPDVHFTKRIVEVCFESLVLPFCFIYLMMIKQLVHISLLTIPLSAVRLFYMLPSYPFTYCSFCCTPDQFKISFTESILAISLTQAHVPCHSPFIL